MCDKKGAALHTGNEINWPIKCSELWISQSFKVSCTIFMSLFFSLHVVSPWAQINLFLYSPTHPYINSNMLILICCSLVFLDFCFCTSHMIMCDVHFSQLLRWQTLWQPPYEHWFYSLHCGFTWPISSVVFSCWHSRVSPSFGMRWRQSVVKEFVADIVSPLDVAVLPCPWSWKTEPPVAEKD